MANIDTVPMIMIEGVDHERINNNRLKQVYSTYNPTRSRIVFRNGKCLRKAAIEFSTDEDAKAALLFSRNLDIDGITIRHARLATSQDRDWFRKPVKKRFKKEKSRTAKHKEILSQIHGKTNDNNDNRKTSNAPVPNIKREPQAYLHSDIYNASNPPIILNMPGDQFLQRTFAIVTVERMVNCVIGASCDLAYPYEISIIRFSMDGLETGRYASFHKLIDISHLPAR